MEMEQEQENLEKTRESLKLAENELKVLKDIQLKQTLESIRGHVAALKADFGSYLSGCQSYALQEQRKLAYFHTKNILQETLDTISESFETVNERYSKGWTWGGNEAIISQIENGFYKLPSS